MKTSEARIAFVSAREAFRVAKLERERCEKRVAILRKRELSMVWASLAHDEMKEARAIEEKARREFEEAEQMLAIVVDLSLVDSFRDVNVKFERVAAKVARFLSQEL